MTAQSQSQVNAINKSNTRPKKSWKQNSGMSAKSVPTSSAKDRACGYCGENDPPRKCPAWDNACSKCRARNHSPQVCKNSQASRGKAVLVLEEDFSSEYDYEVESQLFVGSCFVGNLAMTAEKWQAPIQGQGRTLLFKLDTGAQANVLPLHLYQKLKQKSLLKPTQTILTAFGNTKIQPAGTAQHECCIHSRRQRLNFFVTEAANVPILGQQACESLDLVRSVDTVQQPLMKADLFK